MNKEDLQRMLAGKTIYKADLSHGTVKLQFNDGTVFEREKTCEGEIMATLYDSNRRILGSCKI